MKLKIDLNLKDTEIVIGTSGILDLYNENPD